MLGDVLIYDKNVCEGVILGEDTNRYNFVKSEWKSCDVEPLRGMKVDFIEDGNLAKDIYSKESSPSLEQSSCDNIFMRYYVGVLKNYVNFEGRARRAEYWFFTLFNWIIGLIITSISAGSLSLLYSLAVFLPTLAVSVRRLHDTNRSGWWLLILLIPVVGLIVFTIFTIIDSDEGVNRYGPNPKKL